MPTTLPRLFALLAAAALVAAGSPARADEPPPSPLLAAIEVPAINLSIWGVNRFLLNADYAYISGSSIATNLTRAWTYDVDSFEVNQFGHPYQGALSFNAARSAGVGFWWSILYPVGASLMWELAMEIDAPSINDQITTPLAGVLLGEALHRLTTDVLRSDGSFARGLLAALLNPMRALNRAAFGMPARFETRPPSRYFAEFFAGGTVIGGRSNGKPGDKIVERGGRITTLGVRLLYGLPGPDLDVKHPFGHFELDVELNLAAQPFATLGVRGLLHGWSWHGESFDAFAGLQGMYYFFNPVPFRISSIGVGFGGMLLRRFTNAVLVLTAGESLVPMGAAGLSESKTVERDYHLGSGHVALLNAAFVWHDRVRLEAGARHHFLVALGGQKGSENIVIGDVRLEVRAYKCHAVGVRLVRASRTARFRNDRDDPGSRRNLEQDAAVVRLYWAFYEDGPGASACSEGGKLEL